MTPQPSPPTPLPVGGGATARTATIAAGSCSSLPIPAAATVVVLALGRLNCKANSATVLGSPSPLLITLLALPNGIPSSTAFSPKSRKTGPPSLWTVTPKSSTSSATPAPEPVSPSRLTSTAETIPSALHPIQSKSAVFPSNDIRLCQPGTIRLLRCESIVASGLSSFRSCLDGTGVSFPLEGIRPAAGKGTLTPPYRSQLDAEGDDANP